MKRTVVLLATLLLSFGLTNAANQVQVNFAGDTIWVGQAATFDLSIENDALLGGISLGFIISSPDGATWTLDNVTTTFAPATPYGGTFVTGVDGSRWMSHNALDGSCWDLGGTLVNDSLAPDRFLLGGAGLSYGLAAGGLQHMLSVHFTGGGVSGEGNVKTLCIDSMFYPPAGEFIFDPGGTPAWNGPYCKPVAEQQDPCPVWDAGLPTSMTINHCGSGQVTLHAVDPEPDPGTVYYYLVGVTGGTGTATVGLTSGVVTYTPSMTDVGQAITIEVEATDAFHQEGGCLPGHEIDVTVTNNAPTINCNTTIKLPVGMGSTLTHQILASDPDGCDVLAFSVASVTPTPVGSYDIDAGTGLFTFNTDEADKDITYTFCIEVTDGYDTDDCCFEVEVLSVVPWEVQIEKTHQTLQGHFVDVAITMNLGSEPFGGFDLLIGYDASALAFTEAALGDALVQCGWEYFTYRYNWNGNCGNACPSGLVRLVGMAETNNGPNHPDIECIDALMEEESLPWTLVTMTFFVSNDRTLECMYVPIRFYWMDCGDNTISSINGDTLAMDRFIYDVSGGMIQDYEYGFPGYVGAPDYCLEGDKVEPLRFIDFVNGGIDIVCGDSIDARGDINVNGVVYEIADAVMFTNYFISGLSAFGSHIEASIAASDVNADGIALSVADLVYLVRVIVGDANPYPKPQPNATATLVEQYGRVTVDASLDLGAVLLTFQVNGEIGTPILGVDMDMKYARNGDELRVLIYDIGSRAISSGENVLVTIPGDVELTGAEVASYEGFTVSTLVNAAPENYALLQNAPNPFNPDTKIMFSIPLEADWTIEVFNVAGQLVREYTGHSQAGTVEVVWDGTDSHGKSVASGIYFYRARTDQFSETKKMVLMK